MAARAGGVPRGVFSVEAVSYAAWTAWNLCGWRDRSRRRRPTCRQVGPAGGGLLDAVHVVDLCGCWRPGCELPGGGQGLAQFDVLARGGGAGACEAEEGEVAEEVHFDCGAVFLK